MKGRKNVLKKINELKILLAIRHGTGSFKTPRFRWEDNIKTECSVSSGGTESIDAVQYARFCERIAVSCFAMAGKFSATS
jgi:hypothetical protein